MSGNPGPSSHAQAKGTTPSGRRRQGVNRPDDVPARPAQGCELGATARENPPAGRDREPVCEPHDSTGEPGAGNRHAGFGERGEETCPRASDCGPTRKRRKRHQRPTGHAPPLDSTNFPPAENPPDSGAVPRNRLVVAGGLRPEVGSNRLTRGRSTTRSTGHSAAVAATRRGPSRSAT